MYSKYEETMGAVADALGPLLDNPPLDLTAVGNRRVRDIINNWTSLKAVVKAGELFCSFDV